MNNKEHRDWHTDRERKFGHKFTEVSQEIPDIITKNVELNNLIKLAKFDKRDDLDSCYGIWAHNTKICKYDPNTEKSVDAAIAAVHKFCDDVYKSLI